MTDNNEKKGGGCLAALIIALLAILGLAYEIYYCFFLGNPWKL